MVGTYLKQKEAITFMRRTEKNIQFPFHGPNEVGKGLELKIKKEMGLK